MHVNPTLADLPEASPRPLHAECDALADLFLSHEPVRLRLTPGEDPAGDGSRAPAANVEAEPPTVIEGLILGHLPVLGAAWVTQYAKFVADAAHRPVALVRVQGGQTRLDLVLPRGHEARVSSRIGAGQAGEHATLRGAIEAAAAQGARWVLRVDETGEVDLASTAGVDEVTVLTGADDPAVVATYRTIKNLTERMGEDGPRLRLGVMGADDAKAAEAEAKVTRATGVFLSRPIETGARVAKVGACTTQVLYRGEERHGVEEIVRLVREARRRQKPMGAREPGPPAMEAAADGRTASPMAEGAASSADGAAVPVLLESLSLTGLATTCPAAPGVVLAHGADGSLHLLADAGASPEGGVRGLLAAAAWADAHADLLEAAHAGVLRGVRAHGATLHLLTRDAKACRGLLDTGVRVHLAVRAGGAWGVTALN
jgi:hypothetical protein